ncbi:unnamed protein product [Protopolystoma xenopodis]|uniref:Uncharacterized protein n=1 Tax=Protopolystoma xenopodis TaxID=117903 RepID=A0A3S5B144_9PLAT|nr:unnamed protein product [Protopolystoma xenopodis]
MYALAACRNHLRSLPAPVLTWLNLFASYRRLLGHLPPPQENTLSHRSVGYSTPHSMQQIALGRQELEAVMLHVCRVQLNKV